MNMMSGRNHDVAIMAHPAGPDGSTFVLRDALLDSLHPLQAATKQTGAVKESMSRVIPLGTPS